MEIIILYECKEKELARSYSCEWSPIVTRDYIYRGHGYQG